MTISAPADGSTFTEGTSIAFTGTAAADAEDGSLTSLLSWTSSLNGSIGSGGWFSKSDLSVGAHTITASVTDSDGLQGSDAITLRVNAEGAITLEVRVAADSDDAEESSTGAVSLGSSDLELVFDDSNQTVGIRFNGVNVPRGVTIQLHS